MHLKIKATNVYERNRQATSRIVVNQGGTRSSKTYSLAQLMIFDKLMNVSGKVVSIARKTMPALKTSVMRDFFEILSESDLYDQRCHNKSDNTYLYRGNLVEFLSMDQPQKKRGAKRNILWLNEANEFTFEDFMQMNMRTTEQVILDYNPSDEFHWIYDKVIPRSDCTFIKSTYLDNPFLETSLIEEIEKLKEVDENYWRIYGLGEKGFSQSTIYPNWDIVSEMPENLDDLFFGIDFGFNNPTAVVLVGVKDQELYIDEMLYSSGLTNEDLRNRLKNDILTNDNLRNRIIRADSAEPDRIEELRRDGFNIESCKKGKNSVKDGIDKVKRHKLNFTERSVNLIKEVKSYQWKQDKEGRILDEPVKFNDHGMDGMRYAIWGEDGVNIRWL